MAEVMCGAQCRIFLADDQSVPLEQNEGVTANEGQPMSPTPVERLARLETRMEAVEKDQERFETILQELRKDVAKHAVYIALFVTFVSMLGKLAIETVFNK